MESEPGLALGVLSELSPARLLALELDGDGVAGVGAATLCNDWLPTYPPKPMAKPAPATSGAQTSVAGLISSSPNMLRLARWYSL